jgi:16S rRNA (cytidine1402-2'-O)-methyltransferase
MKKGKLYLIPTPISGTELKDSLVPKDIEIVSKLKHFIVETPKVARSYLKSIDLKTSIQQVEMKNFDEHSSLEDVQRLVQPMLQGKDIGLMTDAGTPCIADPGEEIVLMCHRVGIQVIPMIGPSSIFLALMASGLNAEKFTFNGYLPRKGNKRVQVLRRLVNMVKEDKGTQIFIEAPYRNQAMFNDIIKLDKNIYLCLAENIGSKEKSIVTKPIKEWREDKKVFKKNPTIYLIGKSNEEF